MGLPVDMGYEHSHAGNSFYRHALRCPHCSRGGRREACESYQAMVRDFERREAPTVEVPLLTMEQLVLGGAR